MSAADVNASHDALWEGVDSLLVDAPLSGIIEHKLGPLAANRLRRHGEPIPPPLLLEGRAAMISMLTAIPLLERLRSSCKGPLVLLKGPEVARLYPEAARRFTDLDILVDDVRAVRDALVSEGFTEFYHPDFTPDWHQLQQTFRWPNLEVEVDVHKAPHWPLGLRMSPTAPREILDASIPSALGVDGISTPAPHHHALILAVHGWAHEPLWTLQDLVDIAVVSAQADERDVERTAAAWEIGRLWRTTQQTIEALFYGGRKTLPVRTWARHLEQVRDRTNLERHVTHLVQGYWGMSPPQGVRQTVRAVRHIVEPVPSEASQKGHASSRRSPPPGHPRRKA